MVANEEALDVVVHGREGPTRVQGAVSRALVGISRMDLDRLEILQRRKHGAGQP